MKDVIDKRNEEERLKKSIVKYWNVNYVNEPKMQETDKAEEVLRRLEQEAALDDAKKREEIEAAMLEAENLRAGRVYNETTGSYSGVYGKGTVDEDERGRINKILHEKAEALRAIIEGNDGQES